MSVPSISAALPVRRPDEVTTLDPAIASPATPHAPLPVLVLTADTGGGHRAAAGAVVEALDRGFPGRFTAVWCDPLGGPTAGAMPRLLAAAYAPVIRWAPWLWAVAYHASDSAAAMALLGRSALRPVERALAAAVAAHRPAAVLCCHPLTTSAATRAAPGLPVMTVITDLGSVHTAWLTGGVEGFGPRRCLRVGTPVSTAFRTGPATPAERARLRGERGLDVSGFVVVVTGGGEGAGGIARRARALLRRVEDVQVVALCGRNARLRRTLAGVAAGSGGRLVVRGYVSDMADWLRCADLVVGKAGPGLIAEATCCGVPLLLTVHVPGQERGNTEFVTAAGAGRHTPGVRALVRQVAALRADPRALASMRAASAAIARPDAADLAAAELAAMVTVHPLSPTTEVADE